LLEQVLLEHQLQSHHSHLNTNGGSGNDTLNLANAKIFYTGNSNVFSASNQFGSTYSPVAPTVLAWPAYQITGSQAIVK
jgi:hypothetical protein